MSNLKDKPLEVFRCNIKDVHKSLNKMNTNKSPGPNRMIQRILKVGKEEIQNG